MLCFFDAGLPTVIITPLSQTVEVTCNVRFDTTVSGIGSERFLYQWYHNGSVISGENRSSLLITNVTEYNDGYYECNVTNHCGDTSMSHAAVLSITST